jgi:hypothetical protein
MLASSHNFPQFLVTGYREKMQSSKLKPRRKKDYLTQTQDKLTALTRE